MPTRHPIRAAFACLALGALLAGCGSKVIDLRDPPDPDPVPAPTSSVNAVRRLQWAWNHRDPVPLDDLFTADYVFVASVRDTAGADTIVGIYRDSELLFSQRLFVTGTPTLPASSAVTLELFSNLVPAADPRPGKTYPWHVQIPSNMHIGVRVPGGDYRVMGPTIFYLVRGDSAKIPQRLIDRGYLPDSTRWWIERWDDQTVSAAAPAVRPQTAMPGTQFTLRTLKELYLGLR